MIFFLKCKSENIQYLRIHRGLYRHELFYLKFYFISILYMYLLAYFEPSPFRVIYFFFKYNSQKEDGTYYFCFVCKFSLLFVLLLNTLYLVFRFAHHTYVYYKIFFLRICYFYYYYVFCILLLFVLQI